MAYGLCPWSHYGIPEYSLSRRISEAWDLVFEAIIMDPWLFRTPVLRKAQLKLGLIGCFPVT